MKLFNLGSPGRRPAPPIPESGCAFGNRTVSPSIGAMRRELAIFRSDTLGAQTHVGQFGLTGGSLRLTRAERRRLRDLIENSAMAYVAIDPRPGLHLIEVNEAYSRATLTSRRIAGNKLFDIFPDNPDLAEADGVANVFESIRIAAQSGAEHAMAIQRYDLRDATGKFVERYWQPVSTPVHDDAGQLLYVLLFAGEVLDKPPPSGPAEYI